MSVIAPGRNLVLIGLMGSGKTTVGRLCGKRLGRPFIDTDDAVERDEHRTIAEIFATEPPEGGARAFREMEARAIRHWSSLRGQVISVGGGAVLDPFNVTALRSTGDLVWLDADAATLASRVGKNNRRPLLNTGEDPVVILTRLAAERADAYTRAATYRLETSGLGLPQAVDAVIAWARLRPGLLAREERTL